MTYIALTIVVIAMMLMAVQVMYPFILVALIPFVPASKPFERRPSEKQFKVSVIIPVHGPLLYLLPIKLDNVLASNYPPELLEVVVSGDGNLSSLAGIVEPYSKNHQVKFSVTGKRIGKNQAMNQAVKKCTGDIIVVSDVDGDLDPQAIKLLAEPFADPEVGGVGAALHVINKKKSAMDIGQIQKYYWRYENWLKTLEVRVLGSVTANHGPLLAVRRSEFPHIPDGVADDLFLSLAIVGKKLRYVAQPGAILYFGPQSKTLDSEVTRRRRIVTGSMTSMWMNRRILKTPKLVPYALSLIVHKLLRRLSPFILIGLLVATSILALQGGIWPYAVLIQLAVYGIAFLAYQGLLTFKLVFPSAFFWAANQGMFLGVIDFLRGRRVSVWK